MIVYLDLDRTIYKTRELEAAWGFIAEQFPEAVGAYARRKEFFHDVGDSYYYDMSAHVVSLGLEPQEVYKTVASSELADGRAEYEGVKALVEWLRANSYDVKVFTLSITPWGRSAHNSAVKDRCTRRTWTRVLVGR